MKLVMVMFDSLNRHMLAPYGCDWTQAPNFQRLAQRCVTFDRSYVCSMPCMPARRDLHTGRPNFLHRSWGPMEPFDDSMPQLLRDAGIHSHLATDHYHYFEDGGCTYHNRYSTWEFFRGQEGDKWKPQVAEEPAGPNAVGPNASNAPWPAQDRINRKHMRHADQLPQSKTFRAGLDFLDRNHDEDNWFLQIETFDPHEPFFSHRSFKDRYPEHYLKYAGQDCDWPAYGHMEGVAPETLEHLRYEYASLMTMCDTKLGDVLDAMDRYEMWDDTMLVVWTDHGFMLGEHNWWAKMIMPMYEEISHTPFFVWDPRTGRKGDRCDALVQPSIDLAPTVLSYFNQPIPPDMRGCDLAPALQNNASVRDAAIFGIFGSQLNIIDDRYVYLRAPDASVTPHEHTLMPTHMRGFWTGREFKDAELVGPLSFTKDYPVVRVPRPNANAPESQRESLLFDLREDPAQLHPLNDEAIEQRMLDHAARLMQQYDTPPEQYQRYGVPEPQALMSEA